MTASGALSAISVNMFTTRFKKAFRAAERVTGEAPFAPRSFGRSHASATASGFFLLRRTLTPTGDWPTAFARPAERDESAVALDVFRWLFRERPAIAHMS